MSKPVQAYIDGFGSSSLENGASQQIPKHLNGIRNAGMNIDNFLRKNIVPDLAQLLRSYSGLSDQGKYYTDLYSNNSSFIPRGQRNLSQTVTALTNERGGNNSLLRQSDFIPYPNPIREKYNDVECKTFMGILPEINSVWITFDSQLYLWNYEKPGELGISVFDEQDQIISAVGLVKPKTGVFLEEIEWIIIVTTPLEIIFLGLTYAKRGDYTSTPTIFQTDMSLPADKIVFSDVIGTPNGRIFLTAINGNLYELQYQSQEGWFSRKANLVNLSASSFGALVPSFLKIGTPDSIINATVDKQRNILWTVTESGKITGVLLVNRGKDVFEYLGSWSLTQLSDSIWASHLDQNNIFLQVFPVSSEESSIVHLVAIAASGKRFYFSLRDLIPYEYRASVSHLRSGLNLYSVRDMIKTPEINTGIHQSLFFNGSFLTAVANSDDRSFLISISPDSNAISKTKSLIETHSFAEVDGSVWDIKTLNKSDSKLSGSLNKLSILDTRSQDKVAVLTSSGIYKYYTLTPMDVLITIILESRDHNNPEYDIFLRTYGKEEACAACLAIACSPESIEKNSRDSRKFSPDINFNGNRDLVSKSEYSSLINTREQVTHLALKLFVLFGGSPQIQQAQPIFNSNQSFMANDQSHQLSNPQNVESSVVFSGRHDGLYLFVARALSSIWKGFIFNSKSRKFDIKNGSTIQKSLDLLINHVEHILPNGQIASYRINNNDTLSWETEAESIRSLLHLVKYSTDSISFLSFYSELDAAFKFTNRVDKVVISQLEHLTFENLISSADGSNILKRLISAYIDAQIAENVEVEHVGRILKQVCPTLCQQVDILFYKGKEALNKALACGGDLSTKKTRLNDAFTLFANVLNDISYSMLEEIVNSFIGMDDYEDAIALILKWTNNCKQLQYQFDHISNNAENFSYSYNRTISTPNNSMQNTENGLFIATQGLELLLKSINKLFNTKSAYKDISERRSILKKLFSSIPDSESHFELYKWLVENKYSDDLLAAEPAYLEVYLSRCSDLDSGNILNKYYVQTGQFAQAASLCNELAAFTGLYLDERIKFLMMADSYARTASDGLRNNGDQIIIKDLEHISDNLQIATVQNEILKYAAQNGYNAEVKELNLRLMDISELFNKYAVPWNLYHVQLWILSISESGPLIRETAEKIWGNILIINEVDSLEFDIGNITPEESSIDLQKSLNGRFLEIKKEIVELGSRYSKNSNVFPVPFLTSLILGKVYKANRLYSLVNKNSFNSKATGYLETSIVKGGFVVQILTEAGVSVTELFDVLNELFDSSAHPWTWDLAKCYLLEEIAFLISKWLEQDRKRKALTGASRLYGNGNESISFGSFGQDACRNSLYNDSLTDDGIPNIDAVPTAKVKKRLEDYIISLNSQKTTLPSRGEILSLEEKEQIEELNRLLKSLKESFLR